MKKWNEVDKRGHATSREENSGYVDPVDQPTCEGEAQWQ
jgi:hypothetical protein